MSQLHRVCRTVQCFLLFFCLFVINAGITHASVDLPATIPREDLIQTSNTIFAQPKLSGWKQRTSFVLVKWEWTGI